MKNPILLCLNFLPDHMLVRYAISTPLPPLYVTGTDTTIKVGNSEIKENDYEKLLGITFDEKLNFKKHIEDLCRKANQKIPALALVRLSNFVDPIKSEMLVNPFVSSQFNYCPLLWVFNDRTTSTKLCRTFEKAPQLVCRGSE